MSVIITLVHGTWGERSEWTRPGSALRESFERALRGEVVFRVFAWTGRNSFAAREGAGEQLRVFLREGFLLYPDGLHSIIAHSHGGNIALKTLEDEELRRKVDTVICLSTPFLTVTARRFGSSVLFNKQVFQVGFAGLAAILIDCMFPWWRRFAAYALTSKDSTSTHSLAYLGLVVLLLLQGLLIWGLLEGTLNAWRRYAQQVSKTQAIRTVSDLRLLVIRPPADEASGAFSATQFAAWFSTAAWQLVAAGQTWLRAGIDKYARWSREHKVWSYLLAVAIMLLSFWLTRDDPMPAIQHKWLEGPILLGLTALLIRQIYVRFLIYIALGLWTLLVGLMFLPVLAILCIAVLPFSPWDALLMGPLQIASEAAPIGRCEIMQMPPSIDSDGLMHSTTYEHRLAVGACVSWIAIDQELRKNNPGDPRDLRITGA